MKTKNLLFVGLLAYLVLIVSTSCEKKTDETNSLIDIEMSYSPNPAVVDSVITLTFEAVEAGAAHDDSGDDHHFELSMVSCEVHGGTSEEEITLTHHEAEGHYEGEWTFTEVGTYELHFGYMYENEMFEKEFEVMIIAN